MGKNLALPAPMKARDVSKLVNLAAPDPYQAIAHLLTNKYSIEPKYDGCRLLIELRDTGNIIWSRGRNISANLPHLRDAIVEDANGLILDGELLANGPNGQVGSAATSILIANPAKAQAQQATYGNAWFMAFDVIHLGALQSWYEKRGKIKHGQSVMTLPYDERRDILREITYILGPISNRAIQLVPHWNATRAAIDKCRDIEGVMIKRNDSLYVPGAKNDDWSKVKWTAKGDGFITGWTPGEGSNAGLVGSLTLGVYDGDQVVNVAKVGVFPVAVGGEAFRRRISAPDGSLKREWYGKVVAFRGQSYRPGGSVRHPQFDELRPDKGPEDCDYDNLVSVFPYA